MSAADRPDRGAPRRRALLAGRTLWSAIGALLALWLVGLAFDLGGDLVHVLLVAAIALLVYDLLSEHRPQDLFSG